MRRLIALSVTVFALTAAAPASAQTADGCFEAWAQQFLNDPKHGYMPWEFACASRAELRPDPTRELQCALLRLGNTVRDTVSPPEEPYYPYDCW